MLTLTPNARALLCQRYVQKGEGYPNCFECGESHETDDQLLDRITFGNADFREMIGSLDFLPNSPTIFNAGTSRGTLSACFKFDVADSMLDEPDEDGVVTTSDSITGVGIKSAAVQKWGGGVGYSLGKLRAKGTHIASTHGKACGPIAVMKFYHSIALMITQGGKRAGAQMGILPWAHPDIREFIHCKDADPEALSTFNISVACSDAFMEGAAKAYETPGEDHDIEAREACDLLREISESAWGTGDPGLYFIEQAEKRNPTPWLGSLTGTNPCGEVPLLDNEPCNLGSINLAKFVLTGGGPCFDLERLGRTARLAIRYLDEVLDQNWFPHPAIAIAANLTRKLGLGVMGWADALALLGIHYDTEEAIELGSVVMSTINRAADGESRALTKEKGPNPAFLAKYGEVDSLEMPRNATRTCIAPTGSIYLLAGLTASGIEPHFATSWTRTLGDGTELVEEVMTVEGFQPRTSGEISWEWHVKHQAAFQKFTDLAVSKTINMPNDATVDDVMSAYIAMWRSGCTGGTVYRDGSRSNQVLRVDTVGDTGPIELEDIIRPRMHLPRRVETVRWGFSLAGIEGFIHAGHAENGELGEVFLTFGKDGSTIAGLLDALAISISLGRQSGVPLETYVRNFRNRRFEPYGLTDDPEIPTATSIVDYVARWLAMEFLNGEVESEPFIGMVCDDCGAPAINQEGCLVCSARCGWSRC